MQTKLIILAALPLLFFSCQNGVRPIDYGHDECYWCQMKIMDPQYGSEVVTDKGRVYTFDSAECLVHYICEADCEHSDIMVTDFDNPHHLIRADSATYLISEKMPSPMGADLNAFASGESAESYWMTNGGTIHDWDELVALFRNK